MKKIVLFITLFAIAFVFTGCGHNLSMLGVGTGWRLGNGEYGFSYGDGLFGTFVTKDGVQFKAELDSTTGLTYDPSTNTYKGIKSISYELPPQITGYAVDFAKENPEVAKAYYEALGKYYEIKGESAAQKNPLISEEKSKSASKEIADAVKKVFEKALKQEQEESKEESKETEPAEQKETEPAKEDEAKK